MMSKSKIILCSAIFILSLIFGMFFPEFTKRECIFEPPVSEDYNKPVKDRESLTLPYGVSVNINTASASSLTALPAIGPALAKRIVKYRESNGDFTTIEDVMKVPGISKKTFDKIKNSICVK